MAKDLFEAMSDHVKSNRPPVNGEGGATERGQAEDKSEPLGGGVQEAKAQESESRQTRDPGIKNEPATGDQQRAPESPFGGNDQQDTTGAEGGSNAPQESSQPEEDGWDLALGGDNPFSEQKPSSGDPIESVDQLLSLPMSEELKAKLQQQFQSNPKEAGKPFDGVPDEVVSEIDRAVKVGLLSQDQLEKGFDPRTGHESMVIGDSSGDTAKKYAEYFFQGEGQRRGLSGQALKDYVSGQLDDNEDNLLQFARHEAKMWDHQAQEIVGNLHHAREKSQQNRKNEQERQVRERQDFRESMIRDLRGLDKVPGTTSEMPDKMKNAIYQIATNPQSFANKLVEDLRNPQLFEKTIRRLAYAISADDLMRDAQTDASAQTKREMVDRASNPGEKAITSPARHRENRPATVKELGDDFFGARIPGWK